MSDGPFDPDSISRVIHSLYSTLSFKPPPRQFTILAAFVLYAPGAGCVKVISLGTGSKCLPETRLCKNGDVVHDCHAEVLARRGAVRWFMQEVGRLCDRRAGKGPQETADQLGNDSPWLKQVANGKFALNDGVRVMLYVSTPPCKSVSFVLRVSTLNATASRWRRVNALSSVISGSRHGSVEGLQHLPCLATRDRVKRARQLSTLRCTANKTWTRRLAADVVHVMQR